MLSDSHQRMCFFVSAGEISADIHAAFLVNEIRQIAPSAKIIGCGGDAMTAAGIDVLVQTAHLGYVRIHESFSLRSPIRLAQRELTRVINEQKPDFAILVDSERFNSKMVKILSRRNIPIFYYLSPQIAYWASWRVHKYARHVKLIIPALYEEFERYRNAEGRAKWVGHPLVDIVKTPPDAKQILNKNSIELNRTLVALMPGSRVQEIEEFTPTLLQTARSMLLKQPNLQFVLPVADDKFLAKIKLMISHFEMIDLVKITRGNQYAWMSQSDLLLVSSGTVTLEATILGVPIVVFYKLHPITYIAARLLIRTRFIALPNILLGKLLVPELIQDQFTAKNLTDVALRLLDDAESREEIKLGMKEICKKLGDPGAIGRAASLILDHSVFAAQNRSDQSQF